MLVMYMIRITVIMHTFLWKDQTIWFGEGVAACSWYMSIFAWMQDFVLSFMSWIQECFLARLKPILETIRQDSGCTNSFSLFLDAIYLIIYAHFESSVK